MSEHTTTTPTTPAPIWILMVAMADPAMTEAALSDCLAQSVPVRVLLILQGADPAFQDRFQAIAEQDPRLLVWSHDPALPSLAATWNAGLRFVWETGGEEALVVNNDVRIDVHTVRLLSKAAFYAEALFVSAVGVTKEQYDARPDYSSYHGLGKEHFIGDGPYISKGGPDFSCFLITKAGHERFPFDEGFIPAYCEDLDTHRRYLLDGSGDRIFSINLPYWHIGSGTLKAMTPEARARHERLIGTSRAHYARKWGGPVNQERYTIPFDATTAQDGVTTPELQAAQTETHTTP